jgi:hypothetical protein
MPAPDIRALVHDPELQTIRNRNSQLVFLKSFGSEERWVNISEKQLANIHQITVDHVKRLCSMARKRAKADSPRMGLPPILTEHQEYDLVQVNLEAATNRKCLRKGEVLDDVEQRYGKALTYGWINAFLAR